VNVLEEHGFRYFRGGRLIQIGQPEPIDIEPIKGEKDEGSKPSSLEDLLKIVIRGLPRAMQPLIHRRKGFQPLSFTSEYDIQDLLHALLRPWISDIRPEEFCPSYAGSNTRMDFLLPAHNLVIETKRVRDKKHASKVGDECRGPWYIPTLEGIRAKVIPHPWDHGNSPPGPGLFPSPLP